MWLIFGYICYNMLKINKFFVFYDMIFFLFVGWEKVEKICYVVLNIGFEFKWICVCRVEIVMRICKLFEWYFISFFFKYIWKLL